MRNLNELLNEIIPPSDYQHRNGFSNDHIIDSLSENEIIEVENELIKSLKKSGDHLIGDTLAYMKSIKSLPILNEKLNSSKAPDSKINWASFIFRIDSENEEMKDIAFQEFQKVSGKYKLIGIFHTLYCFNDSRINDRIKSYQNDKVYLIAYNARTIFGLDTKDLIEKERLKNKNKSPWWKFW